MFCRRCGTQNKEGASFCCNCGAPMKTMENVKKEEKPEASVKIQPAYKPIGMWEYFGYEILFSVPLLGFIILLIFSFGGTKNVNLKNFARSYFCLFLLQFAAVIALTVWIVLSVGTGNLWRIF